MATLWNHSRVPFLCLTKPWRQGRLVVVVERKRVWRVDAREQYSAPNNAADSGHSDADTSANSDRGHEQPTLILHVDASTIRKAGQDVRAQPFVYVYRDSFSLTDLQSAQRSAP